MQAFSELKVQVGGDASDPERYNVNVTLAGNPPQRVSDTAGGEATGMALGRDR